MHFKDALAVVRHGLSRGSSGVLVDVVGGRATVTAGNSGAEFQADCALDLADGAFGVDGRIGDLMRTLPDDFIVARDEKRITIRTSSGRYNFTTLPAAGVPVMPEHAPSGRLECDAPMLRDVLASVVGAAAETDLRLFLNGVHLRVADTALEATASNGHMMATNGGAVHCDGEPFEQIIPTRAVKDLLRLLPGDGQVVIEYVNGQNPRVTFRFGEVRVRACTLATQFPSWRGLLEKHAPSGWSKTESPELAAAIDRLAFAFDGSAPTIHVAFGNGPVTLRAGDSEGALRAGSEVLPATCDASINGLEFAVNAAYFRSAVASLALGHTDLRIGFGPADGQAVVLRRADTADALTWIIMPTRV